MKCNCGFEGEEKEFGLLRSSYSSTLLASKPKNEKGVRINLGMADVHICPKCGALYCSKGIVKG